MENYISLHFNENKAQTLIFGTETQITLFNIQKITVLLETVSCASECCFVKILLEYFHDMSNTVHPYKHHSHAQT
jgi:predicted SPOUT superfamily RNA methylase MTH1